MCVGRKYYEVHRLHHRVMIVCLSCKKKTKKITNTCWVWSCLVAAAAAPLALPLFEVDLNVVLLYFFFFWLVGITHRGKFMWFVLCASAVQRIFKVITLATTNERFELNSVLWTFVYANAYGKQSNYYNVKQWYQLYDDDDDDESLAMLL